MKPLKFITAAVALLISSAPALAWDGIKTGQISEIDVTEGNNFGVRVYLNGQEMCGSGGVTWAYLNAANSNYQAYVAALYSAWLNHRGVTIYTTLTSGTYCEIGYIQVF